ncbi:MAG TPA: AAA family ATPase [Longimicrobium sp.]|nr:AAA family ATPase [Longimicrobium sp.]
MYITKLSISNLRSFREAEVEFCRPGCEGAPQVDNVTLLLGDNGAGKTSVLRAVALAALAPVIGSSGFRPYRLVRQTGGEAAPRATVSGDFILHNQDLETADDTVEHPLHTETLIERRGDFEQVTPAANSGPEWEGIFYESSPAFLVLGYGASRRVETESPAASPAAGKSRFVRYERVSGLFEEGVSLVPLKNWLPRFRSENPDRHRQVITLINRLLPPETRIREQPEGSEYIFLHNSAPVPFAALSDGYRAFVGWIADLLYHICIGAPSGARLDETRGIVLVDEVDLHLHPAWQRVVVPQLAKALPNLQFILTSHSPLVVGTLHSENLRLIEADETGASTVKRLQEHVHGLTADQILVSSYFGLSTPRAPEAVAELVGLSRRAQEGDATAARAFLSRLSDTTFTLQERAAAAAGTDALAPRNGTRKKRRKQ